MLDTDHQVLDLEPFEQLLLNLRQYVPAAGRDVRLLLEFTEQLEERTTPLTVHHLRALVSLTYDLHYQARQLHAAAQLCENRLEEVTHA